MGIKITDIYTARTARGLTQVELAELAGVSQVKVSRFEKKLPASIKDYIRIVRALEGVPVVRKDRRKSKNGRRKKQK